MDQTAMTAEKPAFQTGDTFSVSPHSASEVGTSADYNKANPRYVDKTIIVGKDGSIVFSAPDYYTSTPEPGFLQKSWNVGSTILEGAGNEVTNHFGRIAESAGLGAAGTVALYAGGAALTALALPEIAIVGAAATVGVAALATAAYFHKDIVNGVTSVASAAGEVAHDAMVVADPVKYPAADFGSSKQGLENLGAGAADVTAGLVGGIVAGGLMSSLTAAGRAGAAEVVTSTGRTTPETVETVESEPITPVISLDAADSEAGKVTTIAEHADGPLGSRGTFSLNDAAADTSFTKPAIRPGQLTSTDGSVQDVFYHPAEATIDETMARLSNEQAAFALNRMIGFDSSYPESQGMAVKIGGETNLGWIQESAGKPLETELRDRAIAQFGTSTGLDQNVTALLNQDPVLNSQVEQAAVERMVYGDGDIATRNFGFFGDGTTQRVRNFDMGEAFGDNQTPQLASVQNNLSTIGLQNALSGRALSESMQTKLSNFLQVYDNPAGSSVLQDATSLNQSQVEGVLGRTKWLVDNARMPEADPSINALDLVSWYRNQEIMDAE